MATTAAALMGLGGRVGRRERGHGGGKQRGEESVETGKAPPWSRRADMRAKREHGAREQTAGPLLPGGGGSECAQGDPLLFWAEGRPAGTS